MNSFNEFGLAQPLLLALAGELHTSPTPIQINAIPAALSGRDLIGIAQTGTGKTAAFALPIIHRLVTSASGRHQPKSPRALVLTPTRELALQVYDRFEAYGRGSSLRNVVAVGGVGITSQIRSLASGVDVLIATPGRLQDLIGSGTVDLGGIEIFVLDEADRMLDMGFIGPIKQIAAKLPSQRQTLFFSATMPKAIAELCKMFLTDPISVSATPVAKAADRIEQSVVFVHPGDKMRELEHVLSATDVERALVFARTKRGADRLVRGLVKSGVNAKAIHGDKTQSQRVSALNGFRSGKTPILVATDIAARGIDVANITHVINYNLPAEPEVYVHRIGRTARAGADGIAISLCADDERQHLKAIEKLIDQRIVERSPEAGGKIRVAQPNANAPRKAKRRRRRRGNAAPAWLFA